MDFVFFFAGPPFLPGSLILPGLLLIEGHERGMQVPRLQGGGVRAVHLRCEPHQRSWILWQRWHRGGGRRAVLGKGRKEKCGRRKKKVSASHNRGKQSTNNVIPQRTHAQAGVEPNRNCRSAIASA